MTYVDAAVAPLRKTGQIKIHGPAAFEGMRKAGQLVAHCLDMLVEHVQPGVPTEKIDRLVFDYAMDHGALPATLMYRGYKKSTCTSLNHVVCHGIPGDKPLKEGRQNSGTAHTRAGSLTLRIRHRTYDPEYLASRGRVDHSLIAACRIGLKARPVKAWGESPRAEPQAQIHRLSNPAL